MSETISNARSENTERTISVEAEAVETVIAVERDGIILGAIYTGDYEVDSFVNEEDPLVVSSVILPTNNKRMTDDVTINSMPTAEEYNSAGGVTITIG